LEEDMALLRSSLSALVCLFLVAILAVRVSAAEHPVPLDPKADSSTCIACHADKSTGASVHSAIAKGCTNCHEIRVNDDVTRVKLVAKTPYALCLNCHADKNAAGMKGTVHAPAANDCLKCHDPHSSDNKYQLLLSTSGRGKGNLCLSCHKTVVDVPEHGSRHEALAKGCETCHRVHKTGETGKAEFDFHLTKPPPALCVDCHDVKSANLQRAHPNEPLEKANCVGCHNPHASAHPHLLQKE
jgi:predicted CXXCH cytochrome family protein